YMYFIHCNNLNTDYIAPYMKSKVIRRNSEGTGGAACGRTGEPEFAGLWRKRFVDTKCAL
ncbi:hypothetical protein, partial [Eubacterium pyruvativorans]|uniref:hypothetical protein n=1 Tax=Eubacterium pyruvativorans TaxID=155865 RepID=UPI0023F5495B